MRYVTTTYTNEHGERITLSSEPQVYPTQDEVLRRKDKRLCRETEQGFQKQLLGQTLPNRYSWVCTVAPILEEIDTQFGVEGLVMVLMDGDNKIVGARVRIGEVSSVSYSLEAMLEAAIRTSAVKLVSGHSHPRLSNATPSDTDVEDAANLYFALGEAGIELSEYLVVCKTAAGRELKSVLSTRRFKQMLRGY